MVSAVSESAPDSGLSRPRYSAKAAWMSATIAALSSGRARRIAKSGKLASEIVLGQPRVADVVLEPRGLAVEAQRRLADGAVTLLGHHDVGEAVDLLAALLPAVVAVAELLDALLGPLRRLRAGEIVFLAEDEHHDVGVLLDGAGLSEVRELRPLVLPGFHRARELGERQHGNVELLRQRLQSAG